ncbi:MAG TPA: SRPBCC domain-containing protein [Gaiellaceae bacterium]|nr:SRPBCC domain-containing protein [Gaiellaceae bacterium]
MSEALAADAIRKTLTVQCPVEEAFRVFTEEIGAWWPTDRFALRPGEVREVVLEPQAGGGVYEVGPNGERGRWATVVAIEPPRRLVLAWEVSAKTLGTEIEVRFTAEGAATRVDLEHRGWEKVADEAERGGYESGWDVVLGGYAERLSAGSAAARGVR